MLNNYQTVDSRPTFAQSAKLDPRPVADRFDDVANPKQTMPSQPPRCSQVDLSIENLERAVAAALDRAELLEHRLAKALREAAPLAGNCIPSPSGDLSVAISRAIDTQTMKVSSLLAMIESMIDRIEV